VPAPAAPSDIKKKEEPGSTTRDAVDQSIALFAQGRAIGSTELHHCSPTLDHFMFTRRQHASAHVVSELALHLFVFPAR